MLSQNGSSRLVMVGKAASFDRNIFIQSYKAKDNTLQPKSSIIEFRAWKTKLLLNVKSSNKADDPLIDQLISKAEKITGREGQIHQDEILNYITPRIDGNSKEEDIRVHKIELEFMKGLYNLIILSLHSELITDFQHCYQTENGFYLYWCILKRFEQVHIMNEPILRRKLMEIKMIETETITQYYNRLRHLVSELELIMNDDNRSTNRIICRDNEVQVYFRIGLLQSLRDEFDQFTEHGVKNKSTQEVVFHLERFEQNRFAQKSYDQIRNDQRKQQLPTAMAANNKESCTHCKRNNQNHTWEMCFWNPDNPNNRLGSNRKFHRYGNRNSNSNSDHDHNGGNNNDNGKDNNTNPNNSSNDKNNTKKYAQCNLCTNPLPHVAEYCRGNESKFFSFFIKLQANSSIKMKSTTSSKKVSGNASTIALDSGASHHFFKDSIFFTNLFDLDEPISCSLAAGEYIIRQVGTVCFIVNGFKLILTDVYYVPDFQINLVSIPQLGAIGIGCHFKTNNSAELINEVSGNKIQVYKQNGIYEATIETVPNMA